MSGASLRPRLAVLVSGRGRNLRALHRACADGRIAADPVGVIGNRVGVPALDYARQAGLETLTLPHTGFADRAAFDAALTVALRRWQPDIVALAGFMRVLGAEFVEEFRGRMLNVHPSLLPRYPGLHTHRRVLAAGDAEHGASVHFVTEALDGGPCVIQGGFSVRPDDDEDGLSERVLEMVELKIFPQAVAWMARGELNLRGDAVFWRGSRLRSPLGLCDLEDGFR